MSTATMAQKAPKKIANITGVVVSAGRMQNTVKVRVTSTVFNKRVMKLFATHEDHLVHDPSSAARLGDVVAIQAGYRASSSVRHLLRAIVSPVGGSLEERPSIPTVEELIRRRKDERSRRDDKLVGVADAVLRARVLQEGQTEGLDESQVQDELNELKGRQDVQQGVRKGLNGALKRLKDAGKRRWKESRPSLSIDNAGAWKAEFLKEAEKWEQRSEDWYTEAHCKSSRGRGPRAREEMDWRAQFSASIAYDLRHRAAEIDGYFALVQAFAAGQGVAEAEAELLMRRAQDEALAALCRQLAQTRGVYKTELTNLKAEENWIYSLEWLQDPESTWRWQSHQIRLREDGRLNAGAIERFFRDEAGRNSPVYFAALRESLAAVDHDTMNAPSIAHLKDGMLARRKLIDDLETTENAKRVATKARVKLMWEGEHLRHAKAIPDATREEQLTSDGEGQETLTTSVR